MDARQIYDNFHTGATGTQGLSAAAEAARQLASKYQDRAVDTQKLVDGVQSGWSGDAGQAASQGLLPLAENSLTTHQQLSTGQDIIARQMDSFQTAAAEVQPVPSAPTMQNVITAAISGQSLAPLLSQIQRHNAISQSNVDAYAKYVGASQYNTTNLPPLDTTMDVPGAPVRAVAPVSTAAGVRSTSPIAGPSSSGTRPGPAGAAGVVHSSSAGIVHSPSGAIAPGIGPAAGGSAPGGDLTTMSSTAPPTVGASPPTGGAQPGTAGRLRVTDLPNLPGGSGRQPGAPGPFAGGGPVGAEPGRPAASPRGGVPGESAGARGGIGVAEEAAAERGLLSTRDVSGMTPGVLGAGPAQSADDPEHERKYDYGEDPDELFGPSDRVAPPVLGETPQQRATRTARDLDQER